MNVEKLITQKRDGNSLDLQDLSQLVKDYAAGTVPEYQMAAMAMAIYFQGLSPAELITLTREMRDSGQVLRWDDLDKPVVDKHSTGGIGDKISIHLAPMLAACGLAVPMISGRGLGVTGGTLDKLESIPGFRTDLSVPELQTVVREVGCVITGASETIAPADRKLYSLRDVTGTVPSIPLITSSILSKKLSEGLDALVLDVKWGSGSFMKTMQDAEALAQALVNVSGELGVKTSALITDMNQPLGRVGNAVELAESIEILKNNVSTSTITLTFGLGVELLLATSVAKDADEAVSMLAESIRSGAAYEIFQKMVAAQGGDLSQPRPRAKEHVIEAKTAGFVASVDAEALGWAVIEMGGGRKKIGDKLDHSTGLEWLTSIGSQVDIGEPLLCTYCSDDQFQQLQSSLESAIAISDEPVDVPKLIVKRIAN